MDYLMRYLRYFHESPPRKVDYEEEDYPLRFCSHRWVENQDVSKRALTVWPKIVEIVEYWKSLPKSKHPENRQLNIYVVRLGAC